MALTFARIKFTEEVEAALAAEPPSSALGPIKSALLAKRNASIVAARGDMEKAVRRQYNTLLTLFNEQLMLLDELIASPSPQDIWRAELRFYPREDGTICCRSGGHEVLVGDDFPAGQMLVCTPLSRKARANLIEALMTGKIYSAVGPAGTGKTETIKDTFRMLGKVPTVVNCGTDGLSEAPAEAIEAALASGGKGCPVVFDEFNRLDADALVTVAEGTAGRTFCTLTFNPAYVGGSNLPEALAARVLETPMTVPAYAQIAVVMLSCEGFLKCEELGSAVTAVAEVCREEMSKACHYDFGMRFIKSVVGACGVAGHAKGFDDEAQIVADALGAMLHVRSLPDDRAIALRHIKQLVGVDPVLPDDFTAGESVEQRVAAMVATAAKTRHGVGVVGARDVEATVGAIEAAMGAESLVVRAAGAEGLFGEQGAFTQAFKEAVQKTSPVNVILTARPDDASALMTVLDDNKVLVTGAGGKDGRLAMTPHMRVILFDEDFATATPALISRLGMVSGL